MAGFRWAKTLVALTLVLASQLALTTLAHAGGGIGIVPARVELKEALRGVEYDQTLTVVNREGGELTLAYVAEGEVGKWTTLRSDQQPDQILEKIVVPPSSDFRALIRVAVPADASNGQHVGQIRFQAESGNAQSGMGVSIGIASDFVVNVTGTQKLSARVQDMLVSDVEAEQPPVRLTTLMFNDGNVKANPTIKLQIKDSSGAVVGEATSSETIDPGKDARLETEWDQSGKPAGDYLAVASVTLDDGQKVDEREIKFKMLPKGTLTRAGTLDRVVLENSPKVGAVAKVVAYFVNTGKIDTKAQFVGEVSRDSSLLKVVESREEVVPTGQPATLELFFDVAEAGEYTVVGKVVYEGRETESREVSFQVTPIGSTTSAGSAPAAVSAQAPAQPSQSETAAPPVSTPETGGTPVLFWVVLGALVLAVAGLGALILRRSSGDSDSQPRGRAPVG
jgi:hypothetical protein